MTVAMLIVMVLSSSASVVVTTNGPPNIGSVDVDPLSGDVQIGRAHV